ncbi:MAG: hypothetical protein DRI57_02730 [Deltaproteobacteria bacterium]|nr:MAG: hypothetical protein DRI57_02730 [Deltaproteobacteria bacterium]
MELPLISCLVNDFRLTYIVYDDTNFFLCFKCFLLYWKIIKFSLLNCQIYKKNGASAWGDESVADALKKLIPFLFRPFCNRLIFKSKKIGGTKTGSQLATLSATFSSAQHQPHMH